MFLSSLTLRVWEINEKMRKVFPSDCNLGQLKRVITSIEVRYSAVCSYIINEV